MEDFTGEAEFCDCEHQFHIIPENDFREHFVSSDCWCLPMQDELEPNLWLHHESWTL